MTASSTIATLCPEWCVYDDHDDHPGKALHKGPVIGRLRIWGYADEPISATLDGDFSAEKLRPADLRQLADDALAAAHRIEANQ